MHDVSIPAALIAGLVSFLSPCVLPLVPPYLIYLTGATIEHVNNDEAAQASKRAVMAAAVMFVLGFTTVFVALGASASFIGGLIRAWSAELSILAGIVIIIMGLHFLGLTRIGLLMREGRLTAPKPVGMWGAYVMGLAFAFGWTPCIGPILAAILSIAAAEATVTKGAALLAVFVLFATSTSWMPSSGEKDLGLALIVVGSFLTLHVALTVALLCSTAIAAAAWLRSTATRTRFNPATFHPSKLRSTGPLKKNKY